jgi:hypothetical protein
MLKQNNISIANSISTDLLYEHLADPSKLIPMKQTAIIVNNNESDNEDSYLVDINNEINKNSPKINFNSDKDTFKNNSDKDTIKNNSDKDTLKDTIKNNSDKDTIKNNSDKDTIKNNSDKDTIKNNSDKDTFKNLHINNLDKNNYEKNTLKINSENIKNKYGNYTSRLSSRDRESSNSSNHIKNLQNTMDKNLKINLNNFSNEELNKLSNRSNIIPPNNINVDLHSDIKQKSIPNIANQKEIKFKKMETLAKLMHIKSLGTDLTTHYNMESDIEDMEAELKYHSDIQSKKNGVQLAKSFMCNAITGLEYMNDRYDPFGFKLKGWADQVKNNKDDFDEIFKELLEKYKGTKSKMEPEIKLVMMLMLSAGTFHMSQSIVTGLPGLDDVIKNNPQLISKIQSNINKSISGPTEFEKKKEVYNNVKKIYDNKIQSQKPSNIQSQKPSNIQTQKSSIVSLQTKKQTENNKQITSKSKTTNKPTSVSNLLKNIKNSIPLDSIVDSYNITIGNTIDTESSSFKQTVSQNVKTKSRLQTRNNIQFQNN